MKDAYRNPLNERVKEAYRTLSSQEKNALCKGSFSADEMIGIENKLKIRGLTIAESLPGLERCIFDEKTENRDNEEKRNKEEAETEKVEEKSDLAKNNKLKIFSLYDRRGDVDGSLHYIFGGVSVAENVHGNQSFYFGLGINKAGSVGGNQGTWIGFALNYAKKVGKNQIAPVGINSAEEVMGSQYGICAINKANRVGNNQTGLVNIVSEEIKGIQVGIINHASGDGYRQYGLLNFRPGKRWWNPEVSLFYHDAKQREAKKAERELKRIAEGLESRIEGNIRVDYSNPVEEMKAEEEQEEQETETRTINGSY